MMPERILADLRKILPENVIVGVDEQNVLGQFSILIYTEL